MSVQPIDLLCIDGAGGVVWSVSPEGFHVNLVVLDAGGSIAAHRNDSLDVLIVVLAGSGVTRVDDDAGELAPGAAVLLPRGAVRSVTAGGSGLRYLSIHAQRGALTIGNAATR